MQTIHGPAVPSSLSESVARVWYILHCLEK